MKKGFTLLELIIVIIIVGILATLGFVQYASVIERGRFAEARANLGTLRQLQEARFQDPRTAAFGTLVQLGSGLPAAADPGYYFWYACVAATGVCTATRSAAGGRPPNPPAATSGCTFTLAPDGAMGGTCP